MTAWAPWIKNKVTFVVRVGNGSESLLPGGIPDLQFDIFGVAVDSFESEIDADGGHVVFVELVIGEPEEKTRLADRGIADNDVFEKVVVLSISARHCAYNWFILFENEIFYKSLWLS